jgi:DNA mismatch endonuclease (patch repair protein)
MSRVRQRGTAPELAVAKILGSIGASYRLNVQSLPGSPDFANKARKWAIFVNGCFWHHHTDCPKATLPKSNKDFWKTKFDDNRRRDAAAIRSLRRSGFKVTIVWECETKIEASIEAKLSTVL